MAIHHFLRTLTRAQTRRKEATTRRKAKFNHAVDTRGLKKLGEIFREENVQRDTAYLWLRLRKELGSPGTRRTEKYRSGSPFSIPNETLGQMLAKMNPVRIERL